MVVRPPDNSSGLDRFVFRRHRLQQCVETRDRIRNRCLTRITMSLQNISTRPADSHTYVLLLVSFNTQPEFSLTAATITSQPIFM